MLVDPALVNGIILGLFGLGVTNTGALIFFAGRVARTLTDHDDSIKTQGAQCAKCNRVVAILANEKGIPL